MSSFVILAYMYVVRTFVRQIKNLSLVGLFICVTCPFACLRNESFGTYTHFPDILYQNKKKNEKIMHKRKTVIFLYKKNKKVKQLIVMKN